MKRTNVVVDEELLEEACRITGQRTWSGVIDHALKEIVKRENMRQFLALQGTDWWQGDLAEMRGKKTGDPDDEVPWLPAKPARKTRAAAKTVAQRKTTKRRS